MKSKLVFKNAGYFLEYVALIISVIVVWIIMGNEGKLNPVVMPTLQKIGKTFKTLFFEGNSHKALRNKYWSCS